ESEEKYRSFIENFQGIAFQGYQDFSAAFFHGNVQEITGFIEDDFISGRVTWNNIIHPEDLPIINEDIKNFHVSSNTTDKREYRIVNKDQNIKWVIEYNQKFYDPIVGKNGVRGVIIDNTNYKTAEYKLRESEEKFRNIAEQTSLGLLIYQEGIIKFANSAVADITEYALKEINSWSIEDLKKVIPKEDLPLIDAKLKIAETDDFDSFEQFECRLITKSGAFKWLEIIAKPMIYLGKNAVFSSLVDITAKKKLEDDLKEISRLKSELLSRTSHELKTPLVSIKGYADLLLTQHYEDLDFYTISILHEIKQGCSRLESLIKDLIETSKLESGDIELIKTEEDLAFLIRFCVRDLKGLIETRKHELILDISGEMLTFFEKERIYEVVMNLISNAIKYTPKNGMIIIRSEIQNENYVVSVQDTGIGLTDEEKTKIFKKFGKIERYGQGLDVVSEGSGLGLYISKKTIELHGGNMWVESEGRKKGSTFYFSLPIIKD
ncbi:MAG: ATP-binding protein, partial [Candidatus Thorarchaeota archaeon]